MPDECRPVEVDGEVVMVRGSEPMNEEDRAALAVVVRAVKEKMRADRPDADQMAAWAAMLSKRDMSALRARSLAGRFLAELETERERQDAAEAKLSAVRELLDSDDTSRDIVDQIRFFLDERENATDG